MLKKMIVIGISCAIGSSVGNMITNEKYKVEQLQKRVQFLEAQFNSFIPQQYQQTCSWCHWKKKR